MKTLQTIEIFNAKGELIYFDHVTCGNSALARKRKLNEFMDNMPTAKDGELSIELKKKPF